jgi:hypothetical protein
MRNLLMETKAELRTEGYTPDDIVFIGSRDGHYACSWEEFEKLADFDYDNGFGGQEVADDLLIRMIDGSFFCREEYDGSEWWNYWPVPKFEANPRPITRLKTSSIAHALAEINDPPEWMGKA